MASCPDCLHDSASCQESQQKTKSRNFSRKQFINAQQSQQTAGDHRQSATAKSWQEAKTGRLVYTLCSFKKYFFLKSGLSLFTTSCWQADLEMLIHVCKWTDMNRRSLKVFYLSDLISPLCMHKYLLNLHDCLVAYCMFHIYLLNKTAY